MTTVDRIKSICKERKIPISKLEKDCGFANAYIAQLKKGHLPDDRLRVVSDYLGVSIDFLQFGQEKEPAAADSSKAELDSIWDSATPEERDMLLRIAKSLLHEK